MSNQRYRKPSKRTSARQEQPRVGRIVATGPNEIQLALPIPSMLSAVHGAIESLAGEAGLLIMKALIDEEVEDVVGKRHEQRRDRRAVRWGQETGHVVFAGKKVPISRPRVREVAGREVPLERYRMFQSDARMERSVTERILRGVSTRNYEGAIDDFAEGYGIQKSSVSRHWKAATAKDLAGIMERRLEDLDLAVVMIDGIGFHDFLLVVALGIARDGKKHVLGIWDGATENTKVVSALLTDLVERGLRTDRRYLFVVDGSKALSKGIATVFGSDALIQRCQVHKERNVLAHLPDAHQPAIRQALRAAWGMQTHEEAQDALKKLLRKLESLSPGAASSLQEGLEETITLHRLNVPAGIRKIVRSTNVIESVFARTRELCHNVRRWRSAEMALRWASASLLHAEKRFRRIIGHRFMAGLVQTLDEFDKRRGVA